VTARDEADALELARHDYAHMLAEAVQSLFPGTQITFGPSTDDGFYYDFAPAAGRGPFTDDELPLIEAEMRRIIAADKPLRREEWSRDKLVSRWKAAGRELQGRMGRRSARGRRAADRLLVGRRLARHVPRAAPALDRQARPAAFKLTRVSGAYWRGDQKNAMLSRIYGTGWLNKKQLAAHLTRLEEAAKRDHRRIGQEMDLFHLQGGAGLGLLASQGLSASGACSRPICAARSTPPTMSRSRPRR
jgi:threonyl-tRNA synthetase